MILCENGLVYSIVKSQSISSNSFFLLEHTQSKKLLSDACYLNFLSDFLQYNLFWEKNAELKAVAITIEYLCICQINSIFPSIAQNSSSPKS